MSLPLSFLSLFFFISLVHPPLCFLFAAVHKQTSASLGDFSSALPNLVWDIAVQRCSFTRYIVRHPVVGQKIPVLSWEISIKFIYCQVTNQPTLRHRSSPPVLVPPSLCCRLHPGFLVRPWAVQELEAGVWGSFCSCCSLCPTQLLQHGLFHRSLFLWVLYLPWPCLSLFSIHCPFLNMFPQRHHKLIWLVQFWGAMCQFCLMPSQL